MFSVLVFVGCYMVHICQNHHNCWLRKKNEQSVKFSNCYVKETALILHKMCDFTKKCENLHKV